MFIFQLKSINLTWQVSWHTSLPDLPHTEGYWEINSPSLAVMATAKWDLLWFSCFRMPFATTQFHTGLTSIEGYEDQKSIQVCWKNILLTTNEGYCLWFPDSTSCLFVFYSLWPSNGVWKILVNTGPGNGLLPDGTKPLPESMMTNLQWGLCWRYAAFVWVLK